MPEINLTFTVEEVNTVLIALNKAPIPAEVSVPLSDKIKTQAIPQVQPAAPAEEAKEEIAAE